MKHSARTLARLSVLTPLLLLASCTVPPLQAIPKQREQVPEAPRQRPRIPTPDAAAAEVPDGYRVEVVVKDLTNPSCVEFDGAGNMYVVEAGCVDGDEAAPARVRRISRAGEMRVLADQLHGPGTGLLWHDARLYVSHRGKISTIAADGNVHDPVSGLPSSGDHFNNLLAFGPDGRIYFGQGVLTNAGVVGVDDFVFGRLGRFPSLHDVPARDNGQQFATLDPMSLRLVRTGAFNSFGRGGLR